MYVAVDMLGHFRSLHVTAADQQDRSQVGLLAKAVQAITGRNVELAFVHHGGNGANTLDSAPHLPLEMLHFEEVARTDNQGTALKIVNIIFWINRLIFGPIAFPWPRRWRNIEM